RKGVEQRTGLQTHAAVHYVRFLVKCIPFADGMFLITDGKFKLTGEHIGQLFMRMVMKRADSAHFEIDFYCHHFTVMSKNATGDAVAQIVKLSLFMENKHRIVL